MLVLPSVTFPIQTFNEGKTDIVSCLLDDMRGIVSFRIVNSQMEMKFNSKNDFLEVLFSIEPVETGHVFFYVNGVDNLSAGLSKRKGAIALLIAHFGPEVDEVETMATFYDHFISKLKELNISFEAHRGHVDYM